MKKNNSNLIFRLTVALIFILCAGTFFLPFFEISIRDPLLSSSLNVLISNLTDGDNYETIYLYPFKIISFCFDSSAYFDTSKLKIESLAFFAMPFLFSLIAAGMSFLPNKKTAGIVGCSLGVAGAGCNIAMRILLKKTDIYIWGFKIIISKYLEVEPFAVVNLILFLLGAGASVGMIFLIKDQEGASMSRRQPDTDFYYNPAVNSGSYQNDYQGGYQDDYQGGYQDNYQGDYQGGYQDNYQGGYQDNYQGDYQGSSQDYYQGGFVGDDSPTVAARNYAGNDEVTKPFINPGIMNSSGGRQRHHEADNDRGKFVCTEGTLKGQSYSIPKDREYLIGRSPECNIVLDQKYVFISKKHCGIRYTGDGVYLIKVYSSNGVYIDQKRVNAGTSIKIRKGHSVILGKKDVIFLIQ